MTFESEFKKKIKNLMQISRHKFSSYDKFIETPPWMAMLKRNGRE